MELYFLFNVSIQISGMGIIFAIMMVVMMMMNAGKARKMMKAMKVIKVLDQWMNKFL